MGVFGSREGHELISVSKTWFLPARGRREGRKARVEIANFEAYSQGHSAVERSVCHPEDADG